MRKPIISEDEKKTKLEHKRFHSAEEITTLARRYLSDREPGFYLLRTRPRQWAQITADKKLLVGKEAVPSINGSFNVTVVDVEDTLEVGRDRFYQQTLFVSAGKVFNAAAYVCFKDPQGEDHILFINDKRNWNVPIGRVDGDELTKEENQAFLNVVQGVDSEKAHCVLAAFRELHEETGVDLSQFIAKERVKIIVHSSDDIDPLSKETNCATTVTMQIIINLSTLTFIEIQALQKQFRPQLSEGIKKIQMIPVKQIEEENSTQKFFWQSLGKVEKQPIFSHVGRFITTLRMQKRAPFDRLVESKISKKEKEEPASWYVMVSDQAIPADATIYRPIFCFNEQRSSEDLQKDITLCQQMTGIETFNFSSERLALHETILALSQYYKWSDEKEFENTTRRIYEERVKPFITEQRSEFAAIAQKKAEEVVQLMQHEIISDKPNDIEKYILLARKSFIGILESNRLRYEKLNNKIDHYNASEPGAVRPTPAERQDRDRLAKLIPEARKNKDFIIKQAVTTQIVQQHITQLLRMMLFEQQAKQPMPLLRDDVLAKDYALKPKTFYTNAERRSVLVVGGPASGKSRVTDQQLKRFDGDLLVLDPDLYKKLLLPLGEDPEEIKKHGSRTHRESSIIFDSLIDYWGKLAENGSAPHTLIDVAFAGSWIRGKLSVGTQIEVHSPLLAVLEALKRSFDRGVKTGRYMPTSQLIQYHKYQVSTNLEAMRAGCDFTFYDTSVDFDKPMPVIAQFSGVTQKPDVYNISAMLEYFQKADLRLTAINESTLWGHTPKSTARFILNYTDHMTIQFYDGQQIIACLQKELDGNYALQIMDWQRLQRQLNADNHVDFFLQGLIENSVKLNHQSPELTVLVEAIEERLRNPKSETNDLISTHAVGFDEKKCLDTACKLVEQGVDYVRNTHGLWVYTPPISTEEFREQFPNGIKMIKTTERGEKKQNIYEPGEQLTFDIREFSTKEKCEEAICLLREKGVIESQHIVLTSHVNANYVCSEPIMSTPEVLRWYSALPKKVRAFMVDDPDSVQIVSAKGNVEKPRLDGWIKCSEEHIDALTLAVQEYREKPDNAEHKNAVLKIAFANIYSSGPFNIEDGYDFYVSQTELRAVLEKLIQNPSFYINKHNGEKFIGINLVAPLALRKQERVNAGCYLLLPTNDCDVLTRALAMSIDLDKIPTLFTVTEDDMRRTYCVFQQYSHASAIGKIGLLPAPPPNVHSQAATTAELMPNLVGI